MKDRIKWLDVLKFIGIIEIYLGHFGKNVGAAYPFVFTHHVPLFFFAAGCSATFNKERTLYDEFKYRFTSLLIPFYFFRLFQ